MKGRLAALILALLLCAGCAAGETVSQAPEFEGESSQESSASLPDSSARTSSEADPRQQDEIILEMSRDSLTAGDFIICRVSGYTGENRLYVRYSEVAQKTFALIKAEGFHYGLAPVSSTTSALGRLQITEKSGGTHKVIAEGDVTLEKRTFKRQDFTVAPGSQLEQTGSRENIDHDNALIAEAVANPLREAQFTGAFVMPVEGKISTQYGQRRYTNGKYTSAHSGLDIVADEGTPIKATAAGRVVFSGEMKFYGNTVIIDHGCGIFSFYCHMVETGCETGQDVPTGGVIGFVGTTGYSTGPHLHFQTKVNNINVDPAVFIDTDFIYTQLERMINR